MVPSTLTISSYFVYSPTTWCHLLELSISLYFAYSLTIWCHLHFPFLRTLLTALPSGAIYTSHFFVLCLQPYHLVPSTVTSHLFILSLQPYHFVPSTLTSHLFILCLQTYHLVPSILPISRYFAYSPAGTWVLGESIFLRESNELGGIRFVFAVSRALICE